MAVSRLFFTFALTQTRPKLKMQIVVDGIVTNYQIVEGKTSKEPLLILHGWQRTLTEWLPFAEGISEKYKVVLLDLPGFGLTPKPEKDLDTYDYAEFVKEFLRKLKVEKCTILGHSFGGRVAVFLAAQTSLVSKLILVDSAGLREKLSFSARIKQATIKLASRLLPPATANALKNKLGSDDYRSAGAMRKTFVKIVNQDLTDLLPKIKVPTLIVWGSEDSVLNVNQTKTFKRLIPKAKVRVVWGAGHNPHLEKPEAFLEIVK